MVTPFDPALVFRQSPTAAIVVALDGPRWTILDANDAYLAVTHRTRGELVGRGTFEALPESAGTTAERGAHEVRGSFERALASGERVVLPIQRYDLPLPDAPGGFEEHFWAMSSVPLRDAEGRVAAVLHEVANATERVQGEGERDRLLAQLEARTAEAEMARRVAEAAEGRMAEVFEQAPAFIAVARGPEYVFELANEAYHRLVGQRELVGKTMREALPELEGQGFIELLDRVVETGVPYVGREMPIMLARTPGGEPEQRYVDFVYAPLTEPDGRPGGIFAHGVDVTDKVRARQEIETIVEAVTDGFVAVDADLRYTYVNQRAAEMWQRSREELVGHTPEEIWPGLEQSPFITVLRDSLADRQVRSLEDYAPVLGRWLETRVYPSSGGGLVVFFRDVSERRRVESASGFLADASRLLASSSDYATTLANMARAAVPALGDWCAVDVLSDPESTAWPPAIEQVAIVHQDPAKMAIGRQLLAEFPTDWSASTGLAEVIRTGKPTFWPVLTDEMLVAGARDAHHLELMRALGFRSIMILPLVARDRVLGALTLCLTETERHYTRADLALAEDLAQRAAVALDTARLLRDAAAANEAKTEFLRTISHELRQPLNATMAFLQLWELGLRGPLTPEQRSDLARVQRNQRHLLVLIEDLLSFTRLEAGRLEVEQNPLSMHEVMATLESMIEPQMREKGVEFRLDQCGGGLNVLGDHDRIVQICLNLLTNALRATPAGGRVALRCEADDKEVSVIVRDSGVGIPADKLESIFSPFTQLGRALNQPKEGAGLGLAISRGLAEAMGGTLTATSAPGAGSEFVLRLRRADSP
jgi:PAS domain S-box-containing protein